MLPSTGRCHSLSGSDVPNLRLLQIRSYLQPKVLAGGPKLMSLSGGSYLKIIDHVKIQIPFPWGITLQDLGYDQNIELIASCVAAILLAGGCEKDCFCLNLMQRCYL